MAFILVKFLCKGGGCKIEQSQLVFLTDKLQDPHIYSKYNIPLEFVSFALMKGQMYTTFQKKDTFVVNQDLKRSWGNTVVYGGLFLLKDFDFYIRLLDAYYLCSLSTLYKNHVKDLNHRIIGNVTPIHFDNIESFSLLKYREANVVNANVYLGNLNNPKISSRILQSIHSYRLIDGVDMVAYKNLCKAVDIKDGQRL